MDTRFKAQQVLRPTLRSGTLNHAFWCARSSLRLLFGALTCLGLLGCSKEHSAIKASQLLGTWDTGVTQTEWGPCIFEVTFQPDDRVIVSARAPSAKEPIIREGKFTFK